MDLSTIGLCQYFLLRKTLPMLSQTSIYAIRAMGYLALQQDHKPVLSATIAQEMEIPRNFLSKILNRLVRDGLIISMRGRNGGFTLAKPASQIKLFDIVKLFMIINDFKKCFLGLNSCDGSCGLHIRWKIISEQFEKMLKETTVDQVL
jgi:Rrf2 family protein